MRTSKPGSHPIRTTDAQIEAALARAHEYDSVRPQAVEVTYRGADDTISVRLRSGVVLTIPRRLLQGLENATAAELRDVAIDDFGSSLHWNQLDIDHYVPRLIDGILGTRAWMSRIGKAGGSARSDLKAASARENGAKGGRPKRAALDFHGRDPEGRVRQWRADTLVGTLRKTYGGDFATGVRSDMKLGTFLKRENATSLGDLLKRRQAK